MRQGLAIRKIERRTGLSRNTIKKYLKADTSEPKFTTPERSSKLDPFSVCQSAGFTTSSHEPPLVQGHGEVRRRWIVSAVARSGRSTCASW